MKTVTLTDAEVFLLRRLIRYAREDNDRQHAIFSFKPSTVKAKNAVDPVFYKLRKAYFEIGEKLE